MHRTQILLEEPQYDFLLREARRQGVSLSGLLRRLVAERMATTIQGGDPLDRLAGIGAGTGEHAAHDHDRHLYGREPG